ncbi:MAG: thermonuclease family protein, partial [Culicoidibacterales bacterium]
MKKKRKTNYNKELKKSMRKYPLLGIVIILLSTIAYNVFDEDVKTSGFPDANAPGKINLHHCIDGDTASFLIDGAKTKVRFSGVNTPEFSKTKQEEFGEQAADYTCDALTHAQNISVVWDTTQKLSYDRKVGI